VVGEFSHALPDWP